jgi:alpha-beta hydrolase superfamily lysophospholipase
MASFGDLQLRFWIHLVSRVIQAADDGRLFLRTFPRGRPLRSSEIVQPRRIPVAHGTLEARLASPAGSVAAILLFHGIGERLGYWRQVQEMLAAHHIASLVFHYAGYGSSTGSISIAHWRTDAQAASDTLAATLPPQTPIFFLGFSMGTAVATDAALHLTPAARGLILCQPFETLRLGAAAFVRPRWLARLLPDVWRTVDAVPHLAMPLLLVHGDQDELFPVAHTHRLHASARAAQRSARFVAPVGFSHNAPYLRPVLAYWQPILDFLALHSRVNPTPVSGHTKTPHPPVDPV